MQRKVAELRKIAELHKVAEATLQVRVAGLDVLDEVSRIKKIASYHPNPNVRKLAKVDITKILKMLLGAGIIGGGATAGAYASGMFDEAPGAVPAWIPNPAGNAPTYMDMVEQNPGFYAGATSAPVEEMYLPVSSMEPNYQDLVDNNPDFYTDPTSLDMSNPVSMLEPDYIRNLQGEEDEDESIWEKITGAFR